MNYGLSNEKNFVEYLDNRKIKKLDKNMKDFIYDLYDNDENYCSNNEVITAWKDTQFRKTDFYISIKDKIKRISLKMGSSNSLNIEPVEDFCEYLEVELQIPKKIVSYYKSYHYGYIRTNGRFDSSKKLSSEEYKNLHQDEIDAFNEKFNHTKNIIKCVDRFIIKGKGYYEIDALVHGTPDDFVWLKKEEIYDMMVTHKDYYHTSPHIGIITIGPKRRFLNDQEDVGRERFMVTSKIQDLRSAIIDYKSQ